jgi:oligopeptide transport system substrate-binding protein
VSFGTLPPADFTFVNGTEIKSVDPARITGQPEGRIVFALFEGLVNWHPKTLAPIPGVAERWEISGDGLRYTFYLRPDARWSDGSPVTADDFAYSFRRTLDPMTGSEYSYQLWYIENAKKYNVGGGALEAGDPVEVELLEQPPDALPYARGVVLRGTLEKIETLGGEEREFRPRVYVVNIDGQTRRYTSDPAAAKGDVLLCKQVLFDFEHVGVKVIDARTLELTLAEPTPFFLALTGFYPLFPVNRQCVDTYGYPEWTRPENIVTNGAFVLKERRIRDRIRMIKSPTYWDRENVRLDSVDALAVESVTTALNLYMTGKVDWIPSVPSTVVKDLLEQNRGDFLVAPYLVTEFYRVNTTKPPLNDARVRKALAMAIDRREIVETVTQAGEAPALSLVPPGMPNYESPKFRGYDPERAKKLLADAGYPGGRGFPKISILYNASESAAAVAQLVQAQWADTLGIETGLRQEEWNSFLTSQQLMQYEVARSGWIGDYVDPNTFLDMFVTGGANNQTGWSNARYDELLRQARGEQDPKRRMEIFRDAEKILLDELPIIPLFNGVSKNMVRPYVRGFYPNIQDIHPLRAIEIDQEAKREFVAEGDFR